MPKVLYLWQHPAHSCLCQQEPHWGSAYHWWGNLCNTMITSSLFLLHFFKMICIVFMLCSVYLQDNSEAGPERKWHAGASYRGVHTHTLPHPPDPAEQQHPKSSGRSIPQTRPAGLTQPGQQQDWDPVPGKTWWIGLCSCNLNNLCMHLIIFSPYNLGVIWWAFLTEAADYWPK